MCFPRYYPKIHSLMSICLPSHLTGLLQAERQVEWEWLHFSYSSWSISLLHLLRELQCLDCREWKRREWRRTLGTTSRMMGFTVDPVAHSLNHSPMSSECHALARYLIAAEGQAFLRHPRVHRLSISFFDHLLNMTTHLSGESYLDGIPNFLQTYGPWNLYSWKRIIFVSKKVFSMNEVVLVLTTNCWGGAVMTQGTSNHGNSLCSLLSLCWESVLGTANCAEHVEVSE